jgi:homoaconitase/3-isopropylmalate dehydratase large subunit
MNFIEQSLALAADLDSVTVGQKIRCKVDLAIAHDITGLVAIKRFEQIGIHQVIAESHQFEPGKILIGADSHTYTAGGYGVIAIPVGSTELAIAMTTGTIDLEVPKVSEVYMKGQLVVDVSTKNIISTVIRHFGTAGLTNKTVLFTGPGITALSIEDRMIICNMGIEMGAMIACFGGEVKATDVADTLTLDLDQIGLCYHHSHYSWWFT